MAGMMILTLHQMKSALFHASAIPCKRLLMVAEKEMRDTLDMGEPILWKRVELRRPLDQLETAFRLSRVTVDN